MNELLPILERPFNTSKLVVCNFCSGSGRDKADKKKTCNYCQGEGTLHRVTSGTVKLYQIK